MPSPRREDEFAPHWRSNNLDTIRDACWKLLELAAQRAAEPMHIGVLSSLGHGVPDARAVVLRGADAASRTLACHTDARSPKVAQLRSADPVAWVFYDPPRKVQLRMRGTATVHTGDTLAASRWGASPPSSRRCYLIDEGPGSARDAPGSGLPGDLDSRVPTAPESEAGRANFAVVQTTVTAMDWLFLAHDGHTRAQFTWPTDGSDEARWVIP